MSESISNYFHYRSNDFMVNKKNEPKFCASHQSIKYFRQKASVYKFLQKPTSLYGKAYHFIISMIILISICMTILSTFQGIPLIFNKILYGLDISILMVLSLELTARLWASECVSYYRGLRGKIRFFSSPFRIIDLVIIITSILIAVLSLGEDNYVVATLQWIRFFQTFKMIRLESRFRPWRVMGSVISSQKEHLYITTYISLLALLLAAFLLYFFERDSNPAFDNMGQSLWWSVITLCTIGYGDIYPITISGKVLGSIISIIGVSIFALPAGILGTGLALKVEEHKRDRQFIMRRIPAARLIQNRWRLQHFYENTRVSIVRTQSTSSDQKLGSKKLLTPIERNCLQFILMTKLLVSRHHFKQALKPYDVKDVLEQYSAGHLEMLTRIKHINHKLSEVESMAQSSAKREHEFKNLVNYRFGKLENFMTKMDSKLDELLRIQFENKMLYQNIVHIFNTNFNSNLNQTNT